MKTRNKIMTLLMSALAFTACDNDKDLSTPVNEQVAAALAERYPNAVNVTWTTKGDYVVANFSLSEGVTSRADKGSESHSAWFDQVGSWHMTETDIPFSALPQPVQTAFNESEYAVAPWRVDDVDMLERKGVETIYVIEVEKYESGIETEVDLYYSPDGVLVKTITDSGSDYDYGDYIPSQPSGSIEDYIRVNYPGARITEIDYEHGMTEVDIIDGRTPRELLFDATGAWLYTKTEVRRADVPQAVLSALASSEYAEYRIDDIDHYATPDGEYYRFDLESAHGDVKVDITPDGTLTLKQPGAGNTGDNNQGNGQMVNAAVSEFISAKYPGAVIREYDYDDGYLEVEIWHDSREKDVCFNGRYEWVYTKWDVRVSELPQAVSAAIASSQYASYKIDDLEYIESPSGDYYLVELEQGKQKAKLRIDTTGKIL